MNPHFLDRVQQFLGRSQFFTYSALLHVVLMVVLGTQVYYQTVQDDDLPTAFIPQPPNVNEGDPLNEPEGGHSQDKAADAAKPRPEIQKLTDFSAVKKIVNGPGPITLTHPNPDIPPVSGFPPPSPGPSPAPGPFAGGDIRNRPSAAKLEELRAFNDHQVSGPKGSLNGKYAFTLYVGKYRGGDWNSTHEVRNGQITGGAMPNLTYVMRTWTREKVDAQVHPVPLDLASAEIFNMRPPFIYFSGTRDFTLTDAELENLRKYISVGGAIWGDSSLPGRNSRFDIAFRREMGRVVGDRSMEFEPLPADHRIFTGMKYSLTEPPAGLNFYQEPVYAMRIYGELSIIYTPNDYGDQMTVGLNSEGKIDTRRDVNNRFVAIDTHLWDHRGTYFRNVNEASLTRTYEFSTNLVYYLLTRWQVRQAQ